MSKGKDFFQLGKNLMEPTQPAFAVEECKENYPYVKDGACLVFHPREVGLNFVIMVRVAPANWLPAGFFFSKDAAETAAQALIAKSAGVCR